MHPSDDELVALQTGRKDLREEDASRLAEHLETCEPCSARFEQLPQPGFLKGLAVAGPPRPQGYVDDFRRKLIEQVLADARAQLRGYDTIELVRTGAMAIVFRARLSSSGQSVALKVFDEAYLAFSQASAAQIAPCRRRFRREYDVGCRLRHKHIVAVRDFLSFGNRDVIEMPWIEGVSLREYAEREGAISTELAVEWLERLGQAVRYYSGEGVVHRDLKPENILVDARSPAGGIWIIDFGLSRERTADPHLTQLTAEGVFLGTPRFAAPEQFSDPMAVDVRADLYSLGMTIAWCLTLPGERVQVQGGVPAVTLQRLPPRLGEILQRLTATKPGDRFATADELLAAVAALQSQRVPSRTSTSKRLKVAGWTAVAVMALAGAGWGLSNLASGKAAQDDRQTPLPDPPEPPPATPPVVLTADSPPQSVASKPVVNFELTGEFLQRSAAGTIEVRLRESEEHGWITLRFESDAQKWHELSVHHPDATVEVLNQVGAQQASRDWRKLHIVARNQHLDCLLDGKRTFYFDKLPEHAGSIHVEALEGTFELRDWALKPVPP